MQSASTTLVSASDTLDFRHVARQNGDSFCEVNPVNLAAYANRIPKSGMDTLHYPTDMASYSGYSSQNSDSPSKSNLPIDLAMSTSRDHSQRSELLTSNNPVNLAAYAHKQLEYDKPAASSVSDLSDRRNSNRNQSSASLPHSDVPIASTDVKVQGTSSAPVQPGTCEQNTPALTGGLASASSALTQQAAAYPHSLGSTQNNASSSSYQSAHWQAVLSPQLMATAVHASGQPLHVNSTMKDGERSPLLLQFQTAQLQALLRGFPSTSSVQCQSAATLAADRRQYACHICGKRLSSQHNLRLHEATIHRGLFQFHCPICNKGLRQERDLRGHLANRHDWKKEFRCSICGHEFGYKRNLKHHVMSHHGRASLDE